MIKPSYIGQKEIMARYINSIGFSTKTMKK
jgi:hypothetical protein